MSTIKRRRVEELQVSCHPGTNKERKQAEFLVHGSFPFDLVERIGVRSDAIRLQTLGVARSVHRPAVEVRANWYF